MAPSSKRQKSRRKNREFDQSCDRLSNLPDDILVHILSFLPTKYAVGTCILSKRWEMLWASVPNLDFDQHLSFLRPKKLDYPITLRRGVKSTRFINFVDRVLRSHRLSHIEKFHLHADHVDVSYLTKWIRFATERHVKELVISVPKTEPVALPVSVYSCENLVNLKLNFQLELNTPVSISFPNLKIFHILLLVATEELMQKFFCASGFPVLEELRINLCHPFMDGITFNISAHALKRLDVNVHALCAPSNPDKIVISAPNLECFTLMHDFYVTCLLKDPCPLKRACVGIGDAYAFDILKGSYTAQFDQALHSLLRELSEVRCLKLLSKTVAVLNCADGRELPKFDNLIDLELDFSFCCHLSVLPNFLHHTPNLQILLLSRYAPLLEDSRIIETSSLILPKGVPDCLLLQLKHFQFFFCRGLNDELEVIEYLLKNSKVLQRLSVHFYNLGLTEKENAVSQISMFPRASSNCRASYN